MSSLGFIGFTDTCIFRCNNLSNVYFKKYFRYNEKLFGAQFYLKAVIFFNFLIHIVRLVCLRSIRWTRRCAPRPSETIYQSILFYCGFTVGLVDLLLAF